MRKSNPKSFRFDIERMSYAKEKLKIDSDQKILDYLLDEFWFKNHQRFDIPPTTVNNNQNFKVPNKVVIYEKTFQQHMNEISELQFEDEYRKKYAEIEAADNISEKQKQLLYQNMKTTKL